MQGRNRHRQLHLNSYHKHLKPYPPSSSLTHSLPIVVWADSKTALLLSLINSGVAIGGLQEAAVLWIWTRAQRLAPPNHRPTRAPPRPLSHLYNSRARILLYRRCFGLIGNAIRESTMLSVIPRSNRKTRIPALYLGEHATIWKTHHIHTLGGLL